MPATILLPALKPEIDLAIDTAALEERSTIVHCTLTVACLLRISPQTFLVQEDGSRRALLHAYRIVQAPAWDFAGPDHNFTLVFEGLGRTCRAFDLVEDVQEPYPFHFTGIARNGSDVYHLEYPNFPFG
ncbi:hypothetical protein [Flaviaesturariibacter amylovorans]|uniref:Uncharacterized protein n=1 Tax=Flaviaesturariibacter amylovorans TaxID=1084520 RepID=A0ABP8HDR3_9BACT